MRSYLKRSVMIFFLFLSSPVAVNAGANDWTVYEPGVVKSAIAKGETLLLGYLSTW